MDLLCSMFRKRLYHGISCCQQSTKCFAHVLQVYCSLLYVKIMQTTATDFIALKIVYRNKRTILECNVIHNFHTLFWFLLTKGETSRFHDSNDKNVKPIEKGYFSASTLTEVTYSSGCASGSCRESTVTCLTTSSTAEYTTSPSRSSSMSDGISYSGQEMPCTGSSENKKFICIQDQMKLIEKRHI